MTSTAYNSLSLPLAEDSMEVSTSPAAAHFDDIDIDIDFGDYGTTGAHATDDERMFEDGDPTRPATATDDMMDDADNTIAIPVVEEVMQDGHESEEDGQQEIPDEELIDYDDDPLDDLAQPTFDDTASSNPRTDFNTSVEFHTESDHAETDVSHKLEEDVVAEVREAGLEEQATEHEPPEQQQQIASADGTPNTETVVDEVTSHNATEQDGLRAAQKESMPNAEEDFPEGTATAARYDPDEAEEHDDADEAEASPQLLATLDTSVGHLDDTLPTPTDTGLHPLTVKFEGYELPLFRSHVQPDGLLKDDNLVNVSLADLLHNLRQRLQLRTGAVISEDQELTVAFERLGLVVNESSRSASAVSLNDILEVYLHLHENDGVEDIPPMSMSLSRLLKFTSSFNVLKQAASQGQGISSFSFLDTANHHGDGYQEADEAEYPAEDLVQQNGDVHDTDESHSQTQTQDFAENNGTTEGLASQANGTDQVGTPESTHVYHGAEDEESEYHQDQLGDLVEHEEYPDSEDDEKFGDTDTHKEDANDITGATDRVPITASEAFNHVDPGTSNLQSAASSVTIGHEVATDGNGEYNPDINHLDEDLNEGLSTTYAENEDDAPSTRLPDVGFETAHGASLDVARPAAVTENSSVVDEQGHDLNADQQDEQQGANLNVEDYPPEDDTEHLTDQRSYDYTDHGGESYSDAGEELVQYEDDEDNQADNIDYTEEGELQPGDEEEQFHTAFDLLEGEEVEHPEQDGLSTVSHEPTNGNATNNEDDIDFDDDPDFGDHPTTAPLFSSNSPSGKRSFEEVADEDDFELEEPELKKARAD